MVRIIIFILFFCLEGLNADNVRSLYDEFYKPGADAKGYVDSLTVSYIGVSSIFYNPANIAMMTSKIDILFSKENYYLVSEISHTTSGIIWHTFYNPDIFLGVSWRKLDFINFLAYDDNENIGMLTAGIHIQNIFIGVNNKIFVSNIESPDFSDKIYGYGLDAGCNYKIHKITVGISIMNLFNFLKYSDEYNDKLGAHYSIGVNYILSDVSNIYLSFNNLYSEYTVNTAVDYKISNLKFSLGISSNLEIGSGIYFNIKGFSIKYGYAYFILENENKSSISFNYKI